MRKLRPTEGKEIAQRQGLISTLGFPRLVVVVPALSSTRCKGSHYIFTLSQPEVCSWGFSLKS
jgi:hypothetical protein